MMLEPKTQTFIATDMLGPFRSRRLVVVCVILVLALAPGHLGSLTRGLMVDAYVQVSAFVAATLLLFYGAERVFRFDIGSALKNTRGFQVPLAALLGATPGCGGAVVVVAAYSSGNVGFGAVVATLTATMGDAAFLLIATRPDAALVVVPLSLAVGVIAGWLVDRFNRIDLTPDTSRHCEIAPVIGPTRWRTMPTVFHRGTWTGHWDHSNHRDRYICSLWHKFGFCSGFGWKLSWSLYLGNLPSQSDDQYCRPSADTHGGGNLFHLRLGYWSLFGLCLRRSVHWFGPANCLWVGRSIVAADWCVGRFYSRLWSTGFGRNSLRKRRCSLCRFNWQCNL